MQTQGRGEGVAPTHSQPGTRRRCVVSTTLRPLYPGKDPVRIVQEAGWASGPVCGQHHALAALPAGRTRHPFYRRLGGPRGRSGQDAPTRIRSPDRPARSESLYRLRYPGRHTV